MTVLVCLYFSSVPRCLHWRKNPSRSLTFLTIIILSTRFHVVELWTLNSGTSTYDPAVHRLSGLSRAHKSRLWRGDTTSPERLLCAVFPSQTDLTDFDCQLLKPTPTLRDHSPPPSPVTHTAVMVFDRDNTAGIMGDMRKGGWSRWSRCDTQVEIQWKKKQQCDVFMCHSAEHCSNLAFVELSQVKSVYQYIQIQQSDLQKCVAHREPAPSQGFGLKRAFQWSLQESSFAFMGNQWRRQTSYSSLAFFSAFVHSASASVGKSPGPSCTISPPVELHILHFSGQCSNPSSNSAS